jgi:hypothetical protein
MSPNDLNSLLTRKPFQILTMHLSNGTKYEVRHPELAVVGMSIVWLHVPAIAAVALGQRNVVVSLRHIVEVEVGRSLPSGNGSIP